MKVEGRKEVSRTLLRGDGMARLRGVTGTIGRTNGGAMAGVIGNPDGPDPGRVVMASATTTVELDQVPEADGRADLRREHDRPDRHREKPSVWNGWKHFTNSDWSDQSSHASDESRRTGGGRPSDLTVPSFSGEDSEDVGTSARSYLRQVEAWRRMTLLPSRQQGLVLYQHLTGKAWVAAEELSVDNLAKEAGVEYLVTWITNRYLDLEVTRIGKAFSEFFGRLRRKPGQTIRDYNSEYDRLHARLGEVGCNLPEDCAAWLYVDRLQLEEAAELNLLASVGNMYSLHRLQQAAVIHDRGHRKPWESGNSGKGRKPHTAHYTEADDSLDSGRRWRRRGWRGRGSRGSGRGLCDLSDGKAKIQGAPEEPWLQWLRERGQGRDLPVRERQSENQ